MHEFGSPDVLRYEDAPRPDPLEDDVLVRVHAAGVNPVDWWIRQGTQMVSMLPENPFPITLGMDVSGVVEGSARQSLNLRRAMQCSVLMGSRS